MSSSLCPDRFLAITTPSKPTAAAVAAMIAVCKGKRVGVLAHARVYTCQCSGSLDQVQAQFSMYATKLYECCRSNGGKVAVHSGKQRPPAHYAIKVCCAVDILATRTCQNTSLQCC